VIHAAGRVRLGFDLAFNEDLRRGHKSFKAIRKINGTGTASAAVTLASIWLAGPHEGNSLAIGEAPEHHNRRNDLDGANSAFTGTNSFSGVVFFLI
jgi:hypothetical protein